MISFAGSFSEIRSEINKQRRGGTMPLGQRIGKDGEFYRAINSNRMTKIFENGVLIGQYRKCVGFEKVVLKRIN